LAVLLAEFFLGALVYAGDIVLLSPTASGMQTMCMCVTSVYGSKLGTSLLHTIRTLLVF